MTSYLNQYLLTEKTVGHVMLIKNNQKFQEEFCCGRKAFD